MTLRNYTSYIDVKIRTTNTVRPAAMHELERTLARLIALEMGDDVTFTMVGTFADGTPR